MAYLMIRVNAPGVSVEDMNAKLSEDSKPHEGLIQLRNLMDALSCRSIPSDVDVAVRETTQAISADGDGEDASYDLS